MIFMDCYVAFMKDLEEIKKSSSGGFFYSVEKMWANNGGYVAGVIFNDDFKSAKHICSNNLQDIEKMRGSKYIQSVKGNIFREIEQLLQKKESVLFSGTPCEVAGLKAFLGKEYDSLVCIEVICHGPTSQRVLDMFISDLELKYKSSVDSFSFRYKKYGSDPAYIRVLFENGKVYEKQLYESSFGEAFKLINRPSCSKCKFKVNSTKADITIGDHWGIFDPKKIMNAEGESIVVIHTSLGKKILNDIVSNGEMEIHKLDTDEAIEMNPGLYVVHEMDAERENYVQQIKKDGLSKASKKYLKPKTFKELVKRKTPVPIKKYIKRFGNK